MSEHLPDERDSPIPTESEDRDLEEAAEADESLAPGSMRPGDEPPMEGES